jgi:excisionase family DNA binding protein
MVLTASETARALRIDRRRVYALIRVGVLPAVHLGRQVRVAEVALEQFIKAGGRRLPGGWRKQPERARKTARGSVS